MKQLYNLWSLLLSGVSHFNKWKVAMSLPLIILVFLLSIGVNAQTFSPANGATNVDINTSLTIEFSTNISFNENPTGLLSFTIWEYNSGEQNSQYSNQLVYDEEEDEYYFQKSPNLNIVDGNKLVVILSTPLKHGTKYFIQISKNLISGYDGIVKKNKDTWTFTTAAAPAAPTISTKSPAHSSTGVSLNPNLEITFNENVFKGTMPKFLCVRKVSNPSDAHYVAVEHTSVTVSNNKLTVPVAGLDQNTEYYVTIEPGFVKNAAGVDFAGISDNATWRFTTQGTASPLLLTGLSPTDQSTGVGLNPSLVMTFSEAVTKGSGKILRVRNTATNSLVASIDVESEFVTVSDRQIFIPILGLSPNTSYYITVDQGFVRSAATSAEYAGFNNNTTWRFTTGKAPELADANALSPANGAINVPINTTITLTFKENIQLNTSNEEKVLSVIGNNGDQFYFVCGGGSPASKGLAISNNVLTVTLPQPLDYATIYSVNVAAGFIESLAAIPYGGVNSANWHFETVAPPSPVGTLILPKGDNTHISILTDVEIEYDMAIYQSSTPIDNSNVKNLITINHGIVNGAGGSLLAPASYSVTYNSATRRITIKLNPNSFYMPGSNVVITVAKLSNKKGIEQNEEQTFTFKTDKYNIWEGTTDSNWGTESNWKYGYEEGVSLVINPGTHGAVIPKTMTVPNLIISKGARLTINSGSTLSVDGDLRLYSGNTGAGASLLINGTLNSNANKTVVYQDVSNISYDYYISSPVANATKGVVTHSGSVFEYNTITNQYDGLASGSILIPGKGYGGYSPTGSVFSFIGSINQSEYPLSCVRNSLNYGWNLAGNPYPCAINLANTYTNGGFVDLKPHVYIRDNATFQLYTWNFAANTGTSAGTEIPSMHSFWIQVDASKQSGSFTIFKSDRIHNSKTYHKSVLAPSSINPTIKFFTKNGDIKDLSVVTFIPGIGDSFDNYDSEKRFAKKATVTESYTVKDGNRLVINSFGDYKGYKEIPVGIYAAKAGNYSIGLSSVTGFDKEVDIKLIDKSKNPAVEHDLANGGDYSFPAAVGYNDNRFVLLISDKISTGVNNETVGGNIVVYANNGQVIIENSGENSGLYSIFDVAGQLISSGTSEAFSKITIPVSRIGIVIASVKTEKEKVNKKLLIQ